MILCYLKTIIIILIRDGNTYCNSLWLHGFLWSLKRFDKTLLNVFFLFYWMTRLKKYTFFMRVSQTFSSYWFLPFQNNPQMQYAPKRRLHTNYKIFRESHIAILFFITGIVPLFCDAIFKGIEAKLEAGEKTEFEVTFSMLEIYNENVRDLLTKSKKPLRVRQRPGKGFFGEYKM